jgi:hypothetical protein
MNLTGFSDSVSKIAGFLLRRFSEVFLPSHVRVFNQTTIVIKALTHSLAIFVLVAPPHAAKSKTESSEQDAGWANRLGSALGSSAGCGVSPQQSLNPSPRRRDVFASTRDECATRKERPSAES